MTNNLLKLSKFFLYLAPFSVVIVYQGTLFPFIVGKYVFFRTTIVLALIFFVWAWATNKFQISPKNPAKAGPTGQAKFKIQNFLQPLVIAVALFVIIFLLAGFFGYNPSASFWSNFERGEGGLQMLHFFVFFILSVLLLNDEKAWRKMFIISIWSASLVILYGLAGAMGMGNLVGSSLCLRFAGSLGNPAYVGTYLVFAIFYSLYLAANENEWKFKKWLWIILAFIFFAFIFLTQTRGALLGLGVAVIVFLLYLVFVLRLKKMRWLAICLVIILTAIGMLGIKYRRSIDLMPFCGEQGGNRILDITLKTETAQTRLLLWQQSIKAFKDRPILGWGPENFSAAFEKYYHPRFATWYDRAHNIFFDYLVMTGLLGLLSFLAIFGVYYWQFFRFNRQQTTPMQSRNSDRIVGANNQQQEQKNTYKNQSPITNYQLLITNALLFAFPIAYLVQGLVLFDVLPIYINIFLFLAFAVYKFRSFNNDDNRINKNV